MNDGGLARIKYYKGQMLTARDFEDQQEYHRAKQRSLLRRFPPGIIGGLVVSLKKKSDDPADYDGFLIQEGLAVDQKGNEIFVAEKGLKVPFTSFKPETPFLSVFYQEKDYLIGNGLCGGDQKNNRVQETANYFWDAAPNIAPHITVALIELKAQQNPVSFDNVVVWNKG
jgi:hypothetical protein